MLWFRGIGLVLVLVEAGIAGHEGHVMSFDEVVVEAEEGSVEIRVNAFASSEGLAGEVIASVGGREVFGGGDGGGTEREEGGIVVVSRVEGGGFREDEGAHVYHLGSVEIDKAEAGACFDGGSKAM